MAVPTRDYPDSELEFSLGNWGGGFGWFGELPDEAIKALQWKASQGDEIPDELLVLRNAFAQFGYVPIEEAVARVQGLEEAFAEIKEILDEPGGKTEIVRISDIVDSCVQFSGVCIFDVEGKATDA